MSQTKIPSIEIESKSTNSYTKRELTRRGKALMVYFTKQEMEMLKALSWEYELSMSALIRVSLNIYFIDRQRVGDILDVAMKDIGRFKDKFSPL